MPAAGWERLVVAVQEPAIQTVAEIDLDGLGAINRRYGEAAVDEAMAGWVSALAADPSDETFFFRGDEAFLVSTDEVGRVALRLSGLAVGLFRVGETVVRFSAGVTTVDGRSIDEVSTSTRAGLRAAKQAGGSTVVVR